MSTVTAAWTTSRAWRRLSLVRKPPTSKARAWRSTAARTPLDSQLQWDRTAVVIASASEAIQSRRRPTAPGSPRRFAPRDDDSIRTRRRRARRWKMANRTLSFYREHDFEANSQGIAMPFVMTVEARAEKPNEVHPHVAGLVDVKALGKSHPIILISDHEAPLFLMSAGQRDLRRQTGRMGIF